MPRPGIEPLDLQSNALPTELSRQACYINEKSVIRITGILNSCSVCLSLPRENYSSKHIFHSLEKRHLLSFEKCFVKTANTSEM